MILAINAKTLNQRPHHTGEYSASRFHRWFYDQKKVSRGILKIRYGLPKLLQDNSVVEIKSHNLKVRSSILRPATKLMFNLKQEVHMT